jgi:hypothetical protein
VVYDAQYDSVVGHAQSITLLCPGTHQGMVRGKAEHGSGIDRWAGSGIRENDESCCG